MKLFSYSQQGNKYDICEVSIYEGYNPVQRYYTKGVSNGIKLAEKIETKKVVWETTSVGVKALNVVGKAIYVTRLKIYEGL